MCFTHKHLSAELKVANYLFPIGQPSMTVARTAWLPRYSRDILLGSLLSIQTLLSYLQLEHHLQILGPLPVSWRQSVNDLELRSEHNLSLLPSTFPHHATRRVLDGSLLGLTWDFDSCPFWGAHQSCSCANFCHKGQLWRNCLANRTHRQRWCQKEWRRNSFSE